MHAPPSLAHTTQLLTNTKGNNEQLNRLGTDCPGWDKNRLVDS